MQNKVLSLMLLVLMPFLFLPACSKKAEGSGDVKKKPIPLVQVSTVKRSDAEISRKYLVSLIPGEQTNVVSRASGYVRMWYVDRGDRVRKGQRLAVVEQDELDQQEQQAAAAVLAARANLENTRTNAERLDQLFKQNYTSKAELDAANTAVQVAEAQLASAEASLGVSKTRKGYAEIDAPFDGYVVKRAIDVGSLVGPSGPAMFIIGTVEHVKAIAALPQPDVPKITKDLQVKLIVDSFEDTPFEGKITRFAPNLDSVTRTLEVEIDVPNPKGILKPGMFGNVVITLERLSNVIIIPPLAITRDDTVGTGFVVENNKAKEVKLKLGRTLPNGDVEVLSGLNEGAKLVVFGKQLLRDGFEVKVAESVSTGEN